jgi:hypothetical protein
VPASKLEVHIEALDGAVHTLELRRKHLETVAALADAIGRALPAGAAPSAEQLAMMRMKASMDEAGERRVKIDPAAADGMAVAREALALFIWPRKEKVKG